MVANGFNIGAAYLELLADGARFRQSVEQEAQAAVEAAGTKAGKTLGERLTASLASTGKSLQRVGKTLMTNVTAPILGVGAAAVAVGVEFDTTLRQIVALTDVTGNEIDGIRSRILDLATSLGKDPTELARGFYFLASAGFDTAEAMKVLESTAKASAVGLGDTGDISRIVGSAINAFGKENLTASAAVDQLLRAVKDGTAEAPDFAGALGDVLGTAGQVGATFADTTAAIAAMTLKGIGADEAATSLNQVFVSLLKTTPQAEQALSALGLSSEGLRRELREKGLLATLQTLSDKFAGNDEAAAAVFGNVRALRGILALTSGDAEQVAKVFDDVANGTANLEGAFKDTEGPGREMGRAMAEIKVALISLADDVLPPFTEILHAAVGILHTGVEAFKALPAPVRGGIVQLLALAAALGPVLFIGGKLTSGLGMMLAAFRRLDRLAGGPIGKAISGAIGNALEGSGLRAKLAPATGRLGGFLGSKLGKAMAVGFAAVAIVEVIQTYNDIKAGLDAQAKHIGTDVGNQIVSGTTASLQESKAALETGIKQLSDLWYNPFAGGQRDALQQQLDAVNAELDKRASQSPDAVAARLAEGKARVDAAAGDMMSGIPAAAGAAGAAIPPSIAAAALERQNAVSSAMATLRDLIKNALSPAAIATRDIGILVSKELAGALKDGRAEVRAEAQHVRAVAEQELAALIAGGGRAGRNAAAALAAKLKSRDPVVRAAAQRVKAIVDEELSKTKTSAGAAGAAAGDAFAARLRAAVAAGDFHINAQVGFTIPGHAAGGVAKAGQPAIFGEQGWELAVPEQDMRVFTHRQSVDLVSQAGAGRPIEVKVYNPAPEPASTSTRRELRKLALSGSVA